MAAICSIEFGIINKKLVKPYKLSFTTVTSIDSLWVCIIDKNGEIGIGEAVPLPGYSQETLKKIYHFINKIAPRLIGCSAEEAFQILLPCIPANAFAVSAIVTAMEFSSWIARIHQIQPTTLVYPLSAGKSTKQVAAQVFKGMKEGYRHFKMKIGRNFTDDLLSGPFVISEFAGSNCTFRFDANQAYALKNAEKFCRAIDTVNSGTALWLEQPLAQNAWMETEVLCSKTTFPIMLDESIYNEADIKKAKNTGCAAVKLKLCKHVGMTECLKLARLAKTLGLEVTIGNGVSSDIGNLCEALIVNEAPDLFVSGSECNGFTKLKEKIAFSQLSLDSGKLTWRGMSDIDMHDVVFTLKRESFK